MFNLTIREAIISDAGQLARIKSEVEGGNPEEHLKAFNKGLSKEDMTNEHLLLVAEIDDRVIGYGRASYFTIPENPPANIVPEGWYLMGVVVFPDFRRMGIGTELTGARLNWIKARASQAFYFTKIDHRASIDLHRQFGFVEVTRDFTFPGITSESGVGILFRIDLSKGKRILLKNK